MRGAPCPRFLYFTGLVSFVKRRDFLVRIIKTFSQRLYFISQSVKFEEFSQVHLYPKFIWVITWHRSHVAYISSNKNGLHMFNIEVLIKCNKNGRLNFAFVHFYIIAQTRRGLFYIKRNDITVYLFHNLIISTLSILSRVSPSPLSACACVDNTIANTPAAPAQFCTQKRHK